MWDPVRPGHKREGGDTAVKPDGGREGGEEGGVKAAESRLFGPRVLGDRDNVLSATLFTCEI